VKSLADQLADLEDPAPRGNNAFSFAVRATVELTIVKKNYPDFDPEDPDADIGGSEDDESGSEVDDDAGREHYQAVG
jgi:protein AATF/BFR2